MPDFDTAPSPVILPVNVWFEAEPYENVPAEPIEIWPAYDAGVTLAPNVPVTEIMPPELLMVVFPPYVFAPDNVSVPAPDLAIAPVAPEITPANVVLVVSPEVSVPEPRVIAANVSLVVDVAIDPTVSL